MAEDVLTIVVPCYNEEEVLPTSAPVLLDELEGLIKAGQVSDESRLLFVNDGSKDGTWAIIKALQEAHPNRVAGVKFSRNFGHQNAVLAGMTVANKSSDMIVTIDADLQDDVTKITEMVAKYHEGYDIVFGVRNDRETDTAFKRGTANLFYWGMRKMGVNLVPNHADYRLMSKRAVDALMEYKEENLFLRGIVPALGFKTTKVYYKREPRAAGKSHYPLKKMIDLAVNGVASFTTTPIRLILWCGILIMVLTGLFLIYTLIRYFMGATVSGWPSLMMSIWFLGGFQLVAISVIGMYVGKTFVEAKHRPRFIIEEETFTKDGKPDVQDR